MSRSKHLNSGFISLVGIVLGLAQSSAPALADRTDPDFVPPDVTLTVPGAAQSAAQSSAALSGAAQSSAALSGAAQRSAAAGQPNYANSAAGFAQGQLPNMDGQQNPFGVKNADRLRQPPGSSIRGGGAPPGSGANPNANSNPSAGQQPPGAQTADPTAVIQTSKGTITIRLFKQYAPKTVAAFEDMIHEGFYDGLTFHRVEKGFVIQGGCPRGDGTGDYYPKGSNQPRLLPLEVSPYLRHNAPGVVAMARKGGNPNSASCQFYITLAAKAQLDMQYTVFGGVLSGMDVVNSIEKGDRIVSIRCSE